MTPSPGTPSGQSRGTRKACAHCKRTFADQNALWQHTKTMHGRKVARPLRPPPTPDESMAALFIEAQANRAAGIPNDPWIEAMLP